MNSDDRIRQLEQRVAYLEMMLYKAQEIAAQYQNHPLVKKLIKYAGIDNRTHS